MTSKRPDAAMDGVRDLEDVVADAMVRQRAGRWSADEQSAYDERLANEPGLADAAVRAQQMWRAVGDYSASPELMLLREQALARTRRAGAKRWARPAFTGWRTTLKVAAAAGVFAVIAAGIQLSPMGYRPGLYATSWGEQRTIDLPEGSRIVMDGGTRLEVDYSTRARSINLLEGQAQFSVAKDPQRSFEVIAGGSRVIALGTVFNVEYADREVRVSMLEGRVAVTPNAAPSAEAGRVELAAGAELRMRDGGRARVRPDADVGAMTAWRQGKVIFHEEALGDAVRRINRHSRQHVEIGDAGLAALRISGVFDADDAVAFAQAAEAYLPVTADRTNPGTILLRSR